MIVAQQMQELLARLRFELSLQKEEGLKFPVVCSKDNYNTTAPHATESEQNKRLNSSGLEN